LNVLQKNLFINFDIFSRFISIRAFSEKLTINFICANYL